MRAILVASSILSGCVSSALIPCDDGWECPIGTTCAVAPQPGEPRCVSASCGDGVIGPAEDCDGDDLGAGTCEALGFYGGTPRCSPTTCRFDSSTCEGRCGDGVINGNEACDGPGVETACTTLEARFDYGRPGCTSQCSLDLSSCGYFEFGTLYESARAIDTFCAYESAGQVTALVSDPPYVVRTTFGSESVLPGPFPLNSTDLGCLPQRAVMGGRGTSRHDGTGWVALPLPSPASPLTPLLDVAEFADSLVSVGYGGLIVTGDGTGWTVEHQGLERLTSVWIDPLTQIGYAGGASGVLFRRSVTGGTATWTDLTQPLLGEVHWVGGVASDDVLVGNASVLYRRAGASWVTQPVPPGPISARGPDTVFVGSNDGLLSHHDGRFWTRARTATGAFRELWLAESGAIYGLVGATFVRATALWMSMPFPLTAIVAAPAATVPNLWTLTAGVVALNGIPQPTTVTFVQLAVAADTVFAISGGAAARRDAAGAWKVDLTIKGMTDVAAAGPDRAIAVGDGPSIGFNAGFARHDNGTWTSGEIAGASRLLAVAATSTGQFIAVGQAGTIVESLDDGLTWQIVDPGFAITANLTAIWVSPSGVVFVVGRNGVMLRRDGTTWSALPPLTGRDLFAIDGLSDSRIVIVGDGVILEYDGQAWTPIRPPVPGAFYRSVAVTERHLYLAAGSTGYQLYRAR